MSAIDAMSTDELVAQYARAAERHGEATRVGEAANAEADLIAAAYRELRRRQSESALLALLGSQSEGIRAWAGAHALEFAPDRGEPVLAELAKSSGLIAFTAQMTLREWRAGRLRFP
jgi:hypothetical protein